MRTPRPRASWRARLLSRGRSAPSAAWNLAAHGDSCATLDDPQRVACQCYSNGWHGFPCRGPWLEDPGRSRPEPFNIGAAVGCLSSGGNYYSQNARADEFPRKDIAQHEWSRFREGWRSCKGILRTAWNRSSPIFLGSTWNLRASCRGRSFASIVGFTGSRVVWVRGAGTLLTVWPEAWATGYQRWTGGCAVEPRSAIFLWLLVLHMDGAFSRSGKTQDAEMADLQAMMTMGGDTTTGRTFYISSKVVRRLKRSVGA